MASITTRRIQKELAELQTEPIPNVNVVANEENMLLWQVTIMGPANTPYAGGKFALSVEFSVEFPFKAPTVIFKTKMYHPNIDGDGNVCIGILKPDVWKPSAKMSTILLSLYDLLETPNPEDPLVASIADQYRSDYMAFNKKAKEYTTKFAV